MKTKEGQGDWCVVTGEDTPGKKRKKNLTQRRGERRGCAEDRVAERKNLDSSGMLGGGGALGVGGVEKSRPMLSWIIDFVK